MPKKLGISVLIVTTVIAVVVMIVGVRTELVISRTFHRPVRFELTDRFGRMTLRTVINAGAGGYDPGPVSSDQTRVLTRSEAAGVRTALKAVLASSNRPPGGFLLDGSHWILRVRKIPPVSMDVRSPDYHSGDRDTQALVDFGRLLWRTAKIDEPESNLY